MLPVRGSSSPAPSHARGVSRSYVTRREALLPFAKDLNAASLTQTFEGSRARFATAVPTVGRTLGFHVHQDSLALNNRDYVDSSALAARRIT